MIQPTILPPQLALLQSALQNHEKLVSEQKKNAESTPSFVEPRREEHDTFRVLKERLTLDFDRMSLEKEEFGGEFVLLEKHLQHFVLGLPDFCNRYPLSAASFIEFFGDLAANSQAQTSDLKLAISEQIELPPVLRASTPPPDSEKIISSPSSSPSISHLPTEALNSVRQFLIELSGDGSGGGKHLVILALLQLIDLAEKSLIQAMHSILTAIYPSSSAYDKYSTPDKPSKCKNRIITSLSDI